MAMLQTAPTNLAPALRRCTFLGLENLLVGYSGRTPSDLKYWDARLKDTIAPSFADSEESLEALKEDRQGLGVLRERPIGEFLDSSAIVRTHNWPSDCGTPGKSRYQDLAGTSAL